MKLVWKKLLLKSSPVLTPVAGNGRDGLFVLSIVLPYLFSLKTLIFGDASFPSREHHIQNTHFKMIPR